MEIDQTKTMSDLSHLLNLLDVKMNNIYLTTLEAMKQVGSF